MRLNVRYLTGFFLLCANLFTCPLAAAPSEMTVAERQHLYKTAHGWNGGGINWLPRLDAGYTYTDNVRASPFNETSDHIWTLAPSLEFHSDEKDTGLNGLLQIRQLTFMRHGSQNQTNGTACLAPYYYLGDHWHWTSSIALTYDHELPTSESTQPLADEPTPYRQIALSSSLTRDVGRFTTEFFVNYNHLGFGNTDLISGQRAINDDRNHGDLSAGFETALQSPDKMNMLGWRNEILQQNFTRADFNTATGLYNGFNRDNDGWRSQVTFKAQPHDLLRLCGQTGIEHRSFDQSQWRDKTSFVSDIQAVYLITPLTNLTASFGRSMQTTAFDLAPAYTQQAIKIGIDHELRRNVVLNFSVERSTSDYWDSIRNDKTWRGQIGASYRQNRYITWQARYQYQQRDSSVNLADFDENRFTLGTRIEF